jgi:hypothetical protein
LSTIVGPGSKSCTCLAIAQQCTGLTGVVQLILRHGLCALQSCAEEHQDLLGREQALQINQAPVLDSGAAHALQDQLSAARAMGATIPRTGGRWQLPSDD